MEKLEQLDYYAFILYMLLMAGVGAFFGWFVKDIKQYFKGGNTIPWLIGAISNYMGLFSSFVFVAHAGIAYQYGLFGVIILWSTIFPCLVAAKYLGKRWRRSGIITPVEYMETRFNPGVRQTFSWIGLVIRFLDNMVRLYAIGIFITTATSFSFFESILISGFVITAFTIVGGVWAVVVMDTLQFVILIFASLILVPLSLEASGGLSNLMTAHPAHFNLFNGPNATPLWILVYYLLISLKYNANWVFIQRFYSVKDEKSASKLGYFTAALFFVFPIFFLMPAIAAQEILPDLSNPEMAYVGVAVKLLPTGLMGLMLAAIFSATMSSLNSEFNVMSGVLTNDIYKRLFNSNASDIHYIWVARLNIILVGIVATIGALFVGQLGGAFEANKLLTGIFSIPLAVPLIFGIIFKKPRPLGAIATVIVGIVLGLVLNGISDLSWELATLIEIVVCFLIFFGSGWFVSKSMDYKNRVEEFFKQLNTPLRKDEIPEISRAFQHMLFIVFIVALAISGILIFGMAMFSIGTLGSTIAIYGALFLVLLSAILFFYSKKTKPKTF
ncbi:sodium/solute symporter [Algoriphagus sp. D3-2-R+10]|uniref:sodium:solute symporter family transporter n=1 Tax=Algoriphagus aurantiacus TaxID=3103948 RepID=UPI002B3A83D8|nr:sodium/solute symporter [Algoriphagus sp. D3-2-R+10]MEB2777385.1 sodium/solute symporter [Algoriphagus sp. D3-2-R+10]